MNRHPAPAARLGLLVLATAAFLPRPAAAAPDVPPGYHLDVKFTPTFMVVGDPAPTFSWRVLNDLGNPYTGPGSCSVIGVPGGPTGGTGISGSVVVNPAPTANVDGYVECDIPVGTQGDVTISGQATLTVQPHPVPPTVTTSFTPDTISRGGGASTFRWSSQFATSCTSPQVPQVSAISGSVVLAPSSTLAVTVTCTGAGGSGSSTSSLTVNPGGRPQVLIFAGTGGVNLETVPLGPLNLRQRVWFDFPVTVYGVPDVSITGQFTRNWTDFFSFYMAQRPSRWLGPDVVVPVAGHPPLQVVANAADDDGLGGSGCINNYIGPICPKPYLDNLVHALRDAGMDVRVVNYDWRQAWRLHYPMIRQMVDDAYARGQNEKIYIMGHSQGTALAKKFMLDNPDEAAKIALNFNMGAVFLGTPAATASNVARTGGTNFGIWFPPFMLQNVTGLRIGGYSPATYHMNPSRALIDIIHHNKHEWIFADYTVRSGVATRTDPQSDDAISAQQYWRSLSISPELFDRGVEVQEQMANATHGVPSVQIINADRSSDGGWVTRHYPCSGSCSSESTTLSRVTIPSDGTAPTVSSLGRFSGGPSRGVLFVNPATEHQDIPRDPQVIDYIVRAIRVDRGGHDAALATDHPLYTDADVLAHVRWTLPASYGPTGVSTLQRRVEVPAPENVLEFSTGAVTAGLTISVRNLGTGDEKVYRASQAGVVQTGPIAIPTDSIPPPNFSMSSDNRTVPTLTATASTLFRDGLDEDDRLPEAAVAGDLDALDLHVPLPAEDCEVSISADSVLRGTVRLAGPGIAGVKIASATALDGGPLVFHRDTATGVLGRLSSGGTTLAWANDSDDYTP